MPKVNCCGKELKDCKCGRSRTPERREKADRDKAEASTEPVKDLTDLLHKLDCRAEKREMQAREEMTKLIQSNDEKWKQRLDEDRKELLRIQDEKTDMKLQQAEARTNAEFDKIRKDIIDFKKERLNRNTSLDPTTVLFGGLQDKSFEAAERIVKGKLKDKGLEEPSAVYHKGDEFKGIVFAKFTAEKVAEEVVKAISAERHTGEETIWCKKDLPLNRRVPLSFLLGVRKQLINWGFTKSRVRVQEENNTLTVAGQPVMHATTDGSSITIDWINQEWKVWAELVDSSEFKDLLKKAEESWKKAEEAKGKGKGKDRA